jgi:hypothetical protein
LDKSVEKVAEAHFHGFVMGSIWLRWLDIQGNTYTTDAIIYTHLQYTNNYKLQNHYVTKHRWKIYVTDIFDSGKGMYFLLS